MCEKQQGVDERDRERQGGDDTKLGGIGDGEFWIMGQGGWAATGILNMEKSGWARK